MTQGFSSSRTTRRTRRSTQLARPLSSRRIVRDLESDRVSPLIPVSVRHRRIGTGTPNGERLVEGMAGLPFRPIDVDWVAQQVAARVAHDYEVNRLFYTGDHWQQSDAWTGPRPDTSDPDMARVIAQIARAFVSKNVIKEVTKRKRNGAISKEPHWYFTLRETQKKQRVPSDAAVPPRPVNPFVPTEPTTDTATPATPPTNGAPPTTTPADPTATPPPSAEDGEPATQPTATAGNQQPPQQPDQPADDPDIVEVEEALTEYWDAHQPHKVFKQFVINALLNGRAALRLYVPPGAGAIDEQGNVTLTPDLTLAEAMDYIELHAPDPTACTILTNPLSMRKMGAFIWQDNDVEHAEVVYLDGRGKEAFTIIQEVPTASDEPNQQLALDPEAAAQQDDGEPTEPGESGANVFVDRSMLELGGRLTIYEIECEPLITEQVRTLQKSINKSLTMADNNLTLGGFLERTILNGQMPGHFEPVPGDSTGKKQRWVRDNYETGGGAVNYIQGTPQYGPQGEYLGLANPSIVYRDPVDMTNFEIAKDMYYRSLLEEVDQLHYLLSGEQYASGESRKQSRADFESSLRELMGDLAMAGRWFIETMVAYACWLRNTPLQFEHLRGVFEPRMDPGPATTEGQRSAIELRDAKLLSPQSAMVMAGVDDPDAEQRLIDEYDEQHPDALAAAASGIDPNTGQPIALLTGQQKLDAQAANKNGQNGGLIAEDTLQKSQRSANPKPRIVNPATSRNKRAGRNK